MKYGLWGGDYTVGFEIGSISKTLTAALFYDAIERGEVTAQLPVGQLIPELTGPLREITLAELASHRSGLPMLATDWRDKIVILSAILHHRSPWVFSQADVIRMANGASLETRGTFIYSNTGYALLGMALERAAHQSYAELLQERLLQPLAMLGTEAVSGAPTRLAPLTPGRSAAGFRERPWVFGGLSPAGGIRSDIVDMAAYARAHLNLPSGNGAMTPQFDTDEADTRIGYAWFVTRIGEQDITWHEGSTAGFASAIVLDRQQQRAVVVLSDTAWPVIGPAVKLLLATPSTLQDKEPIR